VAADDISTGELGRRLDGLAGTVRDGMKELGDKVEARPDWADVRRVEKGLLDKLLALEQRLSRSESWGTWGGRLVLGILGAAAVGSLLGGK
jgi:hypothetical protein